MLKSLGEVQEVLVLEAWVSPCRLQPILLLEHGVDDDELVLRTELQKQAPAVVAVSNLCLPRTLFNIFLVSSDSCIDVS